MSPSFLPPLPQQAFSSCLKRSGGSQELVDALPRKRSRVQNDALPHGVASLSSASLAQKSSASFQGPKSLLQIKAERSMKTSPAPNLERCDRSPSVGRTICFSRPSDATTALKGSRSAKDSERNFEGPKSLAEILKEKRQRSAIINVNEAVQESELEEGEFRPSNDKDDACLDSSQSHPTNLPSSASVSPSQNSDTGSKLKSITAPASSMPPAEDAETQSPPAEDAETQSAAASRGDETGTLGTAHDDLDFNLDDFDFDGDIDDADLELDFDENDLL